MRLGGGVGITAEVCPDAADPNLLPNPAHQWLRVFNIQSCPYCTCFVGRGEDWVGLQRVERVGKGRGC